METPLLEADAHAGGRGITIYALTDPDSRDRWWRRSVAAVFVVVTAVLLLIGCATPPPVTVTTTPAAPLEPVVAVCNVCRWVDAQGLIWFTKCGLPRGATVDGWDRSAVGSCSYDQKRDEPLPMPKAMPTDSL